jgi:hypothetical protein
MATTHHHYIEGQIYARHVPPISALLADTEVPEDNIENFLNTNAPSQSANGEKRRTQRLGGQFGENGFFGFGQQCRRFHQGCAMSRAGELIALPGTSQLKRRFRKAASKRVQPGTFPR